MAYDPNEQRNAHGEWTAGGEGSTADKFRDLTARVAGVRSEILSSGAHIELGHGGPVDENTVRQMATKAAEITKSFGFTPDKLTITDQDYKFKIGDKEYTAAGTAHQDTKEIKIYAGSWAQNWPTGLPGVMAHEIMHQKYNAYMDDLSKEREALNQLNKDMSTPAPERMSGVNSDRYWKEVETPSGSLREPYDKQFPLVQFQNELMGDSNDYEAMRKEDGCTNYSKAYWDDASKSGSATGFRTCFHETLAEMARLDYEKKLGLPGREGDYKEIGAPPRVKANGFLTIKPSVRWRKLYDMVNKNWKKRGGL